MHQKGNNIARKITTLLSVLSIGVSVFAMSPTLTYANGSNVTVNIWRPFVSKVGSVLVTDQTQTNVINNVCVSLPNQGTLVPLPLQQGNIGDQDTISIQNFPDGNCQTPVNDLVHRNPMNDYLDLVNTLPPCSTDNTCRIYMTPNEA